MKRLTVFLMILIAVPALFAGERSIEKSLQAAEGDNVTIKITTGSITIKSWDKPELLVTGTVEKDIEELIVERVGNRVVVRHETPHKRAKKIACHLVINLPPGGKVLANLVNGDIEADYEGRELDLRTVNGSINVAGTTERVELQTVIGNIRVEGESERLEAILINGNCRIKGEHPDTGIKSTNGDIQYMGGLLNRLSIYNNNGNMDINSRDYGQADITLGTVNGDIALHIPANTPLSLEARSIGGSINYDKAAFDRVEGNNRNLTLERGEDGPSIRVEMLNGSLKIVE